jgi:ribosomal protein L31E
MTLKKHMSANHVVIARKIEEEIYSPMRGIEKTSNKKRLNVFNSAIF